MAFLRELKWSKIEVDRRDCDNVLLRQTTGGILNSAFREAGTCFKYAELLLEALESQYLGPVMSFTKRFRPWCEKEVAELKHTIVNVVRSGQHGVRKDLQDFHYREKGKMWYLFRK